MQGTILETLKDSRLALGNEYQSILVASQIETYLNLLVKWNRKINLTAEKKAEDILFRHVFDSIQYARFIQPENKIIDIGSGAGFPGIPLKIIYPQLQLDMVDSQRKRCSFLDTVSRKLGFEQVNVINSRVEDIPNVEDGKFDAVVFRAVTESQMCLMLGGRFIPPGGKIILKKSPDEKLNTLDSGSSFVLLQETIISSYHRVNSSLLVFEKCST
jgi:16S rRNA (guanine527-N7)-methyltransferase